VVENRRRCDFIFFFNLFARSSDARWQAVPGLPKNAAKTVRTVRD